MKMHQPAFCAPNVPQNSIWPIWGALGLTWGRSVLAQETPPPVPPACLWQIRAWPAPPNWSRADWLEEIEQIAWIASWQAEREFDPARGKERGAFVYGRVMASALAAYRKEWLWKIRRRCSGSGRTATASRSRSKANSGYETKRTMLWVTPFH